MENSMRIGFYHDSIGTKHSGGIAVYARQLAVELSSSNDVYVYTQDGDMAHELAASHAEIVTTPNFDVPAFELLSSLPLPVSSQPLTKLAMIAWSSYNDVIDHINEHVDVLICFNMPDDLLLSNLVDVPTIRGFLSDVSGGVGTAVHKRYTTTDTNFAISPYLADHVSTSLGYAVDEVVLPGLDADQFHEDAEPAFSSDRPSILFVGRLIEAKGIFDLLDAVAMLETPVHLRVIGTGHAESEVRRRCRELDIEDDVTLEGEVSHDELPGYYTAADIFCLPTHVDSFAMVNLEAMGCGTPVVTTDLEAIKTYLTPDENGVVVPPGDTDALETALSELLLDPSRRQILGARSRDRARQFSWRQQAARLERLCAVAIEEAGTEPKHNAKVESTPS